MRFEEQHVPLNLLSPIFVTSDEQFYAIHSLCCFSCSPILSQCLYLDNNCSILLLIFFSANESFLFLINSILCFKLSSTFSSQSKSK